MADQCSACQGAGVTPTLTSEAAYCHCDKGRRLLCQRNHRGRWRVVQYHGNASAFNGYHWTPSAYSGIRCLECGRFWRTRADYVERLNMITEEDRR